jgi:hypothetical protein
MSDIHLRLLRRIARGARRTDAPPADAASSPARESSASAERSAMADARLAAARARRRAAPSVSPDLGPGHLTAPADPAAARRPTSVADLRRLSDHAEQRLALYRRKTLLGRGEPRRLAKLEREASGAADRLRRAEPPVAGS